MPKIKKSTFDKWKKLALALSIAIVLNVFFNVGVATFYDEPEWGDFCGEDIWTVDYNTEAVCEEVGGLWRGDGRPYPKPIAIEFETSFYCDATYTCQMEFDDAISLYNRNVFVVLTVLGAFVVVLALYLQIPSAVLSGLMYGGVISILVGVMRYWSNMDDYLRFAVSGVILIVLIVVGIKRLKDD